MSDRYRVGESHRASKGERLERQRAASLAYRRTRRRAADHRRSENEWLLGEIGRLLITSTTPQSMLAGVVQRVGQSLGVDRCWISEDRPEREVHQLLAEYCVPGLLAMPAEIPYDQIPIAVIERYSQVQPVVVDDLSRSILRGEWIAEYQVQAVAGLPWADRSGVWKGALIVASSQPRRWGDSELRLLNAVTEWTFLALENARLMADLQSLRSRFDLALRNSPLVIFNHDQNLRYTWIYNPQGGVSVEEALGRRDDELMPDESGQKLLLLKQSVLASGVGLRQEITLTINGQPFLYDLTLEPLLNGVGQVTGVTGTALDITVMRSLEEERAANRSQIEIQHQLIQARERQRTRLAHQLHEGPLQDMLAVQFHLREALEESDRAQRMLRMQDLTGVLQASIRGLRSYCNMLRPPGLAVFGLQKSLRAYGEQFTADHPELTLAFDLASDGQNLSEDLRLMLFRAYQELLGNAASHARARQIRVRFYLENGNALLQVDDDGVGFTPPADWLEATRQGRLGLAGLREWVAIFRGEMKIDSLPGEGARVRICVPIPQTTHSPAESR